MTVLRSFLAQMQAMMLVRFPQLFGSYEDARGAAHGFCKHITSRISESGRQAAQRCARGGRAPPARPTTQPPTTLPAGSPAPHPPTQLPLCASIARLVTPPPIGAGQRLAQPHHPAARIAFAVARAAESCNFYIKTTDTHTASEPNHAYTGSPGSIDWDPPCVSRY